MCLKKRYVVSDLISVNCSEEQNLQIIVKDTEGEIYAAVGYENNSYFHRVFKERYHMTPRAFREKNRQQIQVRL